MLPEQAAQGPGAEPGIPPLSQAEADIANTIYFQRCAGCHGVLRKGATGKPLTTDLTRELGYDYLKNFITYGSPGRHAQLGHLGRADRGPDRHHDPLPAQRAGGTPEWGMKEMRETLEGPGPGGPAPDREMNQLDLDNLFSVTLRDTGQVALIDGTTYEIVKIFETGYAVHISRMSASGRYLYVIGRDALINVIDLYMDPPAEVAGSRSASRPARSRPRRCTAGRTSTPSAAPTGRRNTSSWTALTLEPLKIVSTRGMIYDEQTYHPEPRVASIAASHYRPEFVVNVKETGFIDLVDYTDLKNLKVTSIAAERFLHDGGFDRSGRYFFVAANARNKVAIIDTKEGKLVAVVETQGDRPHPGRGANFEHRSSARSGRPRISAASTSP